MWDCLEHLEKPTIEDKIQSLKTDNIHGRCVWDCEHTVVDHQSVAINFADGATATLNMIGGTAKAERNLHIIGTKGEIKGVFDDSVFTVRTIDTASESGWREEVVDLAIGGDKSGMTGSHGGGDLRLVEDFVRVLQGEQPSISCTNINDSLNGHLAVFRAENRAGLARWLRCLSYKETCFALLSHVAKRQTDVFIAAQYFCDCALS